MVKVWGGPPGQGLGESPWSRSRSRSRGAPSKGPGQGLGPPGQGPGQGLGEAPLVKVWGAPWSRSRSVRPPVKVQIKVRGPHGQGLGAPWSRSGSRSGGPPWSRSRSRSGGPSLSRSKNAGSTGGTPLAVMQEDCLRYH